MSRKFSKKPLALALGAAFGLTGASAQASLFQVTDLGAGYMVAQATPATPAKPAKPAEAPKKHEHPEGKCGEGKCGEGKCGADKGSHDHADKKAAAEGKCGEGKCGEGKCGGKK